MRKDLVLATLSWDDIDYVRDNVASKTNREIAEAIGVGWWQVRYIVSLFGFGRDVPSWKKGKWTQEQVQYLVENFPVMGDSEIALHLGFPYPIHNGKKKVEKKRFHMKLNRTKAQIRAIKKRNLEVWSQFRYKGDEHWAWVPEGEMRFWVNEEGRVQVVVKVGYGQGDVNKSWRFLRHVAWEQAHGPIPKGMMVRFTGDNPLDPDQYHAGNLLLVTKGEHGVMNKTGLGHDICKAVILLNKVNRKLKKMI